MESLAALSLACNVVQLVEFSLQTVKVSRHMLNDSSPAIHMDEHRKRIHDITNTVRKSLSDTSQLPLTKSNTKLLELAEELICVSNDLDSGLSEYDPRKISSKLGKMRKGLKWQLVGKKKLDEMNAALKTLEDSLQTSVLVDLA